MFYSPSTKFFYDAAVHGDRFTSICDPAWVRPLIEVTLQPGEAYVVDGESVTNETEVPLPLGMVPDIAAVCPVIQVANPACRMPADVVEVSDEAHAALLQAQERGGVIQPGVGGRPEAIEPEPLNLAQLKVQAQARIDAYFETLYQSSVANSAIGKEYDAAYMVAKRWYENQSEPVPERVKALSEMYAISNAQAAGLVIQKWTEAQAIAFDQRGAARLRAKTAIRAAANAAAVDAREQEGRSAMEAIVFTI